jgi:superoxide dismutase
MSNDKNPMETFSRFAKERLDNHLAELQTKYENKAMASKELTQEAYDNHKKIFEEELQEKIESLSVENEDAHQKEKIEEIKHSFIEKLNQNYLGNHNNPDVL